MLSWIFKNYIERHELKVVDEETKLYIESAIATTNSIIEDYWKFNRYVFIPKKKHIARERTEKSMKNNQHEDESKVLKMHYTDILGEIKKEESMMLEIVNYIKFVRDSLLRTYKNIKNLPEPNHEDERLLDYKTKMIKFEEDLEKTRKDFPSYKSFLEIEDKEKYLLDIMPYEVEKSKKITETIVNEYKELLQIAERIISKVKNTVEKIHKKTETVELHDKNQYHFYFIDKKEKNDLININLLDENARNKLDLDKSRGVLHGFHKDSIAPITHFNLEFNSPPKNIHLFSKYDERKVREHLKRAS